MYPNHYIHHSDYPPDAVRTAAKRQKDMTVLAINAQLEQPVEVPTSASTVEEQRAYRQGYRRALRVARDLALGVQ